MKQRRHILYLAILGLALVTPAWALKIEFVFENGVEVSAITGLSRPHDVETDAAGNILVVDSNNNRLEECGRDH